MKQKPPRSSAPQSRRPVAPPQTSAQRAATVNNWGLRWHAGHFRLALTFAILAVGFVLTFGQVESALAQWWLRDGYVATRATVVKAPYWADALEPKPSGGEPGGAIAGWHIELRVGDHPFSLAVALTDFDPDRDYLAEKTPPDAARFALNSVHPVWFYANNKKRQPATVALLNTAPALLISRAAFPRFPSLREAIENSIELLILPAILLSLATLYLVMAFVGKRGIDTCGAPLASRLAAVFAFGMLAVGLYLINNEHPLAGDEERHVPAEIEITRGPLPDDRLSYHSDYRVLWRTWQVQARLAKPGANEFTIDVDGLDPRRTSWASRHSPDISAFQPGTRMAVWQSNFHTPALEHLGSMKPTIYWETFLSRERWPDKYTWRHFIQDSPSAVVAIGSSGLLILVWLMPLGGKRVTWQARTRGDPDN